MITNVEGRKLQHLRVTVLAIIVIVTFLVLAARLWYLQIAMGNDLLEAAESNRIKLLRTRAPRGTILDRKGRVLATSRPQFVVLAVPEQLKENREALHTLCGILGMTPEDIDFAAKKSQARPGSPVRVAVDVPLDVVARIGEQRMKLPGVSVELDQIRYYPDGPAIAHIMGYLGEVTEEDLDKSKNSENPYRPGDYVGKAGLEKQYERYLRGIDGGKQVEVNALGRVIRILGEEDSIAGDTLKLNIDRDLQIAAYKAMEGRVGSAVAMNPQTGAVLAMVNRPAYDPNIFAKRLKANDWNSIITNKAHPLQNRAINNVYPPGSTFKPIMAIAGLVFKQCNIHTTVSCPGSFYFGRRFGCWKRHGGGVTFNRAIAESCDVWFYKLGLRLGIDRIAEIGRQFGIGCGTGIDLPRESRYKDGHVGTMPSTAWKREHFEGHPEQQKWYPGETPSCSIGQGYVEASPLQMSAVCAAVANDGKMYRPTLLSEIRKPSGKLVMKMSPTLSRSVDAPASDFDLVRKAMRQTVTVGTGRVVNIPGLYVGGKTGSAENRGPAHAWFICFAGKSKPEIAVACIIEHGRHGASAAAPVCRAILDVYFGKKKVGEIGNNTAHVSGD